MKTIKDFVEVLSNIMSKSGKVVYFARSFQSGYIVSRDEFYPAAHDNLSISGDTLSINGEKINCKWMMYSFAEVKDAIRAGKKYEFAPNAKFVEVPYELAQKVVEWNQRYSVDANCLKKVVEFTTTFGNKFTDWNHKVYISFSELENVKVVVNIDVKRIDENGNKDKVYSLLEYTKKTLFEYHSEKFSYDIQKKNVTLEVDKENVNGIPPRHIEWLDIVEHEFFPASGKDSPAAKKVSRKIKVTRDGKYYIAKLKALSVWDTSETYLTENNHYTTDELYDASWEWEEYQECTKEVIEKECYNFNALYSDDFWKVFYRFSSKEEYELAYKDAYGDGKVTEKAFSDMHQKIESFKKELEEVPFEMK